MIGELAVIVGLVVVGAIAFWHEGRSKEDSYERYESEGMQFNHLSPFHLDDTPIKPAPDEQLNRGRVGE
ncbi:hypothetical protein [Amycolatopsis sp. GM8]|uniref:hypothetical protein n=1 Tax=Amycolatopsis sp. GM8 TaxID=2896530 RepID=UPI001F463D60|nr:hypothetical protein [Amycolatopsis sp. GM8]